MSAWDYQMKRFKRIVDIGFRKDTPIEVSGSHTSKSAKLPFICAKREDSNVGIRRLADNYFYTSLAVELKKPVPATLLYPISGVCGYHSCMGHDDLKAPYLVNFEKAYHNKEPIRKFSVITGGSDFAASQVIGYLDLVSRLDSKKVLDCAYSHKWNNDQKYDCVDGNNVDSYSLAKLLALPIEKEAGYDINVADDTRFFKKIKWGGYLERTRPHQSSVCIELNEGEPLPLLTVPASDILIPTPKEALELDAAGFNKFIPASSINYFDKSDEFISATWDIHRSDFVAGEYLKADFGATKFKIITPNCLDSMLTALYLVKVVAKTLEYAGVTKHIKSKKEFIAEDQTLPARIQEAGPEEKLEVFKELEKTLKKKVEGANHANAKQMLEIKKLFEYAKNCGVTSEAAEESFKQKMQKFKEITKKLESYD